MQTFDHKISMYEYAKTLYAFLIANEVATKHQSLAPKTLKEGLTFRHLANSMLDVRGASGTGKTTITTEILKNLPNTAVVWLAGYNFPPESITGMVAITPDSLVKKIESQLVEDIRKAHAEGKTVIIYIDEIDKMPAGTYEVLLNLISQGQRKKIYGIEGKVYVMMTGNEKDEFNFRKGEAPRGSIERTFTVELNDDDIDAWANIKEEGLRIYELITSIGDIEEKVNEILSKVDINDFRHPFLHALYSVYRTELRELLKKKEGSEIAGIYKYPNRRALDYASLYLYAFEAIDGKLTERTVALVFHALMGAPIATFAKELFKQIYETKAYNYIDAVQKMDYQDYINSLKTGSLYNILSGIKQVPASAFFVAFNLKNRMSSEYTSLEDKLNYAIALNTYLAHAAQQNSPFLSEIINSVLAGSLDSFAEQFKEYRDKKKIKDDEVSDQIVYKFHSILADAIEAYYRGDKKALQSAARELEKEGFDINKVDLTSISTYVLIEMAKKGKEIDPGLAEGLKKLEKNLDTLTEDAERTLRKAKAFKQKR